MELVHSSDGTTIAFDRSGDGPGLILVFGAFGDRLTATTLAGVLATDFTVYSYDRRGRGSSGDTAPYSVEREIEDLDAVISAAGGSAFVFGHSSGAVLALESAARGLPITRLAVYEPPYIVDDSRSRPVDLAGRVSELIASGRQGDAIKIFLVEGVEMPDEVAARIEAAPTWAGMKAIAHTLPYDLAICGDQTMPAERMAQIRIPTLAIDGGNSPEWARNTVRAVAAALPDARRISLEGQTHGAADDVLAPVLVDFFLPD